MSPALASLLGALGAALVTGLFGLVLLFIRRRTEREQLNALVIDQAVKMANEHRTEHAEDVETIARLRDELRGVRRERDDAEDRASHAEQELRSRDAADVLTNQLIDRLQAENNELKERLGDEA